MPLFLFPSTEVLRTNYEKPVPFRNKYYFTKLVASLASTAQKLIQPDQAEVPSQPLNLSQVPEMTTTNSSADDFIINKPPTKKPKVITKQHCTSAGITRSRKILTRAAAAQGQKKVSDYFFSQQFVDPDDSGNSNFLPDLVQRKVEVIVIDSDDEC